MSSHFTVGIVGLGVVALLVGISAFFSSSESAIFSLPAGTTTDGSAPDDRRASTLAGFREDPHRLLVTILVGNNVVNVAISTITKGVLAISLSRGQAALVATILASSVVLVFGEIVPKAYGLGNAERWSLTVAIPLRGVGLLLFPIVVAFDAVTALVGRLLGGDPEIEDQYLTE